MLKIENLYLEIGKFKLGSINLTLGKEEYFVILGETGSGKTLFLESIAGKYHKLAGKIFLNNYELTKLPPEKRGIGFVYQNFELFSHMNVYQNIAFPLKIRKASKKEAEKNVSAIAEKLGILHLMQRDTGNLSGGEKQRTALARALIVKPGILLLDEPMSALDYITKKETQKLLKAIHKDYKPVVIHVTHDINEAVYLSERIGVMRNGRLGKIISVTDEIRKTGERFFYKYL